MEFILFGMFTIYLHIKRDIPSSNSQLIITVKRTVTGTFCAAAMLLLYILQKDAR
jgi:hypothetical protein